MKFEKGYSEKIEEIVKKYFDKLFPSFKNFSEYKYTSKFTLMRFCFDKAFIKKGINNRIKHLEKLDKKEKDNREKGKISTAIKTLEELKNWLHLK